MRSTFLRTIITLTENMTRDEIVRTLAPIPADVNNQCSITTLTPTKSCLNANTTVEN